ncbi:type II restriction enzyme [Helicobacter pylori Hp M1]|nr:type II restriction enzyme [Helicobacter pylori Hp M1]
MLEQSVFFETNKERLILKTLNEESKQNDKKLKRSIKEKALYFEKHSVKKEKGFVIASHCAFMLGSLHRRV